MPSARETRVRLEELREFWKRSRKAHDAPYKERAALYHALDVDLRDWAEQVEEYQPETLEEAVILGYSSLINWCAEHRVNAAWETFCKPPEVDGWCSGKCWMICFESGPPSWAVAKAPLVPRIVYFGPKWFCETTWGIDLVFNDN